MNYDSLSNEIKIELKEKLENCSNSVGGLNFFLRLIEDIRDTKPNPLLNKTAIFHYSNGTLNWEKSVYRDTLTALFNAMKHEEKYGDLLKDLKPKEYKSTMNMMRVLKPINIKVNPKDESLDGFDFTILDTSTMKNTKISLMFKIIFFYNVDFAKKALNFKVQDDI